MSAATEWAWAVKCPDPSTRMVLLALARRADNQTFQCWPRQKLLAEDAQVSVATVKRSLEKLIEMGAIFIHHRTRPDGSTTASVYQLMVNTLHLMFDGTEVQIVPLQDEEEEDEGGVAQSERGVAQSELGGVQFELPRTLTLNSSSPDLITPTSEITLEPQSKIKSSGFNKNPDRRYAWKEGEDLPNEWIEWAVNDRLWSVGQAKAEAASFIDYSLANRRLYANWLAAWRNWCRSAFCKTPKGQPKKPVRIDRW